MEIQALEREFRYNGVRLADPNPDFTLEQVRDFYANVYPEIVSADIDGPESTANKNIYTFRRAVGTKGGHTLMDMVQDLAALLPVNWLDAADTEFVKDLQEKLHANHVQEVPADDSMRVIALHRAHCEPKAA